MYLFQCTSLRIPSEKVFGWSQSHLHRFLHVYVCRNLTTSQSILERPKQIKVDLPPSDFYLFRPLKDALRGRQISTDVDVQEAVQVALRPTENLLLGRYTQACALEQVHCQGRRLC
ncbi:PREDICTED: uncharacterized protein LOC105556256 [Vollenhovia emeryi]|uniref:uncharacterized protein LOC105556256 n=1 Tax=Vollenhovia emeryi TaxID=411798 RepID=UPI0005F5604F|nr:PREDICTED: uncharacterized protein LOC105556256 [Vollenhovia emeryi]